MEKPLVNQYWYGQVDNMLIEFHLSGTNGLGRIQTCNTRLTDRDANHYAIFPPLAEYDSHRDVTIHLYRHTYLSYRYSEILLL